MYILRTKRKGKIQTAGKIPFIDLRLSYYDIMNMDFWTRKVFLFLPGRVSSNCDKRLRNGLAEFFYRHIAYQGKCS